jgi:hypothetical protein
MANYTPAERNTALANIIYRMEPEAQRKLYRTLVEAVYSIVDSFDYTNYPDDHLRPLVQTQINQAILNWWTTHLATSPKDLSDYKIVADIANAGSNRWIRLQFSEELQAMFSGASKTKYLRLPPAKELEALIAEECEIQRKL